MQTLTSLLHMIPSPDSAAILCTQRHVDGLLESPGNSGRLESLVVQLAGMLGLRGVLHVSGKAMLMVYADHGVWDEEVAVSSKVVMAIQTANMTRGTTDICVLVVRVRAKVHAIDVGTDAEPIPGVVSMRVARDCGNITEGPVMSHSQVEGLLLEVVRYTHELTKDGATLFGVGELGMTNTTPVAVIVSVLAGGDAEKIVGIGTNLPPSQVGNKVGVAHRTIVVNQPDRHDSVGVLAKVGGFDLTGITGVMLEAALCGLPTVLDGFLPHSAALAASQTTSQIKSYLTPSYFSAEKGTRVALTHLELDSYLNIRMYLGEGSGAVLAIPIIEAACAMYKSMGQLTASNIVLPDGKEAQLPLNLNLA